MKLDRIDAVICLVVLLVMAVGLTLLGCLYVAQESRTHGHVSGAIVDVAPVVKLDPAPSVSVAAIPALTGGTLEHPVLRSVAPTKPPACNPACAVEIAAYMKAYRNADRANALLGEPRFDTGPLHLIEQHHTL